ncbi:MAG TPA: tetratricopeptide repeat protein [Thermoanaerobaculia bacterium]|jgi:tetratricopeptide (TPR) repeat protein
MQSPKFRTAACTVLAACGLAASAARLSAQQPTPAAPPAAPGPGTSARTVKSPGNAEWAANAADARARATAEHKLVYYEFVSQSCGECGRMEGLLYPAFDFEALLVGMVPVRLDLVSKEGSELSERYSIKETPSVAIATPAGRLVFLMQGFKTQGDFFSHVRKSLDSYRAWANTIDAQNVSALGASDAYQSARQLFARFDYSEARPRFKRASAAPDATPAIRDSAKEGLAACELQLNDPAQARKTIDGLIAATKDPEVKERAELFRAQIPLAQNRPEEALTLYKKFEKDHPQSKYKEQVRDFISRLETGEPPK